MEEATTGKRPRFRERNPLLVKELRGRMRGARAFVVLTVYLLLLSCLTSIIYAAYSANYGTPGSGPSMAGLGTAVFSSVVLIELFMVSFITPAFTTGAITGERERKTYELLRATLLPAHRLIAGKLASALTYVGLLILAAVPLEGLALMLGGVVLEELVLALLILLVTALGSAVVGLFFSSLMRTTLAATVLTYGLALLFTVGLPIVLLFVFALIAEPLIYAYGAAQPPVLVRAVAIYFMYFLVNLSPIGAAIATKAILVDHDSAWYFMLDLGPGRSLTGTVQIPIPSGWIVYTVTFVLLSLVLLLVTVHRVRRRAVD
jgi:ABC-2 type transport system permease protein